MIKTIASGEDNYGRDFYTEVEITCNGCSKKMRAVISDGDSEANKLALNGWVVTGTQTHFCPKCQNYKLSKDDTYSLSREEREYLSGAAAYQEAEMNKKMKCFSTSPTAVEFYTNSIKFSAKLREKLRSKK